MSRPARGFFGQPWRVVGAFVEGIDRARNFEPLGVVSTPNIPASSNHGALGGSGSGTGYRNAGDPPWPAGRIDSRLYH